jgi:alpha-beta hydrolase superfamily lysophospholipase
VSRIEADHLPYQIETHTAGDGYVWKSRHYPPPATARAEVVCVHGIQSHAGWYEHSCRELAKAGYSVSFFDRRGSGMNKRDRGDAPSFRRLLDDLTGALRPLRAERKTVHLVGISWGGKLVTALQRRQPGLVDGLILLCPGFCPKVAPTVPERFAILWSRLTNPTRLFPVPLSDAQLFTDDPRWQQFVRDDPMAVRLATARLLLESARLDGYLRIVPRHVRVPFLLLLAGNDRIIDNSRTLRFVQRFASTDKTVLELPGTHHTLEFEPDPKVFLDPLLDWLDHHSPRSQP